MNSIDLSPLYRSSIGFDRLASMLDNALNTENAAPAYPPYNIQVLDENRYAITVAVAGFDRAELDITVEKSVLIVRGKKANEDKHQYIYQGIANRTFERKFNLADYVEVTGADLNNGLLTINLVREIPESMKPRSISIGQSSNVIEHKSDEKKTEKSSKVA